MRHNFPVRLACNHTEYAKMSLHTAKWRRANLDTFNEIWCELCKKNKRILSIETNDAEKLLELKAKGAQI